MFSVPSVNHFGNGQHASASNLRTCAGAEKNSHRCRNTFSTRLTEPIFYPLLHWAATSAPSSLVLLWDAPAIMVIDSFLAMKMALFISR
jgi:hypothetical protein